MVEGFDSRLLNYQNNTLHFRKKTVRDPFEEHNRLVIKLIKYRIENRRFSFEACAVVLCSEGVGHVIKKDPFLCTQSLKRVILDLYQ